MASTKFTTNRRKSNTESGTGYIGTLENGSSNLSLLKPVLRHSIVAARILLESL